jgi:DnaJ-class molecular chaperone
MTPVTNYYDLLGVTKDADEATIKKALHAVSKTINGADDPKAKQLKEAYGILTDPKKRQQYDAHLEKQNGSATTVAKPAKKKTNDDEGPLTGELPSGMNAWDYLTLKSSRNYGTTKYYVNDVQQRELKNARFADVVNMIGTEGWEMVGIASIGNEQIYVFKRMAQ